MGRSGRFVRKVGQEGLLWFGPRDSESNSQNNSSQPSRYRAARAARNKRFTKYMTVIACAEGCWNQFVSYINMEQRAQLNCHLQNVHFDGHMQIAFICIFSTSFFAFFHFKIQKFVMGISNYNNNVEARALDLVGR